jgi:acetate kinase
MPGAPDQPDCVLTVNAGSSSLKVATFALWPDTTMVVAAEVERIGLQGSLLRVTSVADRSTSEHGIEAPDQSAALRAVMEWLRQTGHDQAFKAVAHRIVHGGHLYRDPRTITVSVLHDLRALVWLDPDHMPQALAAIQTIAESHPGIPQIACFDTAFHRPLPRVAQMYALPRRFWDAGVRRYGFHGLSCEFIIHELSRIAPAAAAGRVIIAHLGNGASLTAVRNGLSVETTMGFSPTGGLVMSTRSGDLDPSVLLYALQRERMSPEAVSRLVNHEAGMLGVSETTHDMRDLIEREATDSRAADAVALFCYGVRKDIGALVATLGGLETLVFTAGIGAHAASVRARICAGLSCFGIAIDAGRNAAHAPIVSRDGSAVVIRVMKTDEDRMLAGHARRVLSDGDEHVRI